MANIAAQSPAPGDTSVTDSIVLEEEIDPSYVPSEDEVVEYAKWLGMDLDKDQDLFWVAREGLMAPLPKNWKPCKTKDTEDIYYFNFSTGESTWDHPCDGYYKTLYEEEKKKKEILMKEKNDQQRSKAKQDVTELLGKDEKNKKKGKVGGVAGLSMGSSDLVPPIGKGMAPLASLERKPLPGIQPLQSMPSKSSSWGGLPTKLKEADSPTDAGDGNRRRQRESGVTNRLASSEPIMGGSSRLGETLRDAGRRSGTALSRVNEDSGTNSDAVSSDADSDGTAVRGKPGKERQRGSDADSKPTSSSSSGMQSRAQSKLTSRLKGALEPSLMMNAAEEKVSERSDALRRRAGGSNNNNNDVEDFKSDDLSDPDASEDAGRTKQPPRRTGGSTMRRPTYVSDPVDDDDDDEEEHSGPRRRPTSRVGLSMSQKEPRDEEEMSQGLTSSAKSDRRVKIHDAKDDSPRPGPTRRDDVDDDDDLRDELEQRKRNFQEEIDFHEAAVRKRRDAMLREQERLDAEQEALKKRRDALSVDSPTSASPGKVRQLENEVQELRSRNERLKEDLAAATKQARREKENAEEARRDFAEMEEDLQKQVQAAKQKANTCKDERDAMELEAKRFKVELRQIKNSASPSSPGDDLEGISKRIQQIDDLEETVRSLQAKLKQEKAAKEAAKNELEEQEIKAARKVKQAAEAAAEADARMVALQQAVDAKAAECDALQDKLHEAEAAARGREDEVEERCAAAEKALAQATADFSDAKRELESVQLKGKRLEADAKTAKDEAADAHERLQTANAALATLRTSHTELEREVEVLRGQVATEREGLAARNAELETQLAAMKKAKGHMESLLLASGDEGETDTVKTLVGQVSDLTAAVARETALVAEKDAELAAQAARVAQLEHLNESVTQQVEEAVATATVPMKAALRKAQAEMLGLASVKEQLESEVTAMATRMRTCAIGCATRIGTFASVGEMTEALDKVAFLEAQNASLSERLAQQASDAVKLRADADAAAAKYTDSRGDVDTLTRKLAEKSGELESLRGKLQPLGQIEAERDQLQRTVATLEGSVASLEQQIAQVRAEAAAEASKAAAAGSEPSAPTAAEVQAKLALAAATDHVSALTRKVAALEADVVHLQGANASLGERVQAQATEAADWHGKYQTAQADIAALNVKLAAAPAAAAAGGGDVVARQLLVVVEAERDMLKRNVETLEMALRAREAELLKARADAAAALVSAAAAAAASSSAGPAAPAGPAGPAGAGAGLTALNAAVAEQQSTVKKLEEKLHAAEVLIVALSRNQEQLAAGGGGGGGAASGSPRRQRKQSTTAGGGTWAGLGLGGRGSRAAAAGAGQGAGSESGEVLSPAWDSSPENDGPAAGGASARRTHAHEMRDLWAKVMSARAPLTASTGRPGAQPASSSSSSSAGDADWGAKIDREQRFVDELSAALKDEKGAIRRDQDALGKRRAAWRARKKALRPQDHAGRADLKAQSEELNAQTVRLNDAVEQTRAMHTWLVQRRKKLDALQEYHAQAGKGAEEDRAGGGGRGRDVREALERLGREMDSEVEVTLMDLANHTSPVDSATADSDMDWLFVGGGSGGRSGGSGRGGFHRGRSAQYEHYQQMLAEQRQQQQQQQQQAMYGGPYQPQPPPYHPPPPMYGAYPGPPPYASYPPPRPERDYYGPAAGAGGYGGYPYYPSYPGGAPEGPPPMPAASSAAAHYATSADEAGRWAVPAASVRFNLHTRGINSSSGNGGSSAPSIPFSVFHEATASAKDRDRDPRVIREQLKEITNRRTQSSEAFETHASWLNNLQQEIGRFSHDAAAVASSARLAAKGSGMAGKVHASVTASTQAGTDTETVQI